MIDLVYIHEKTGNRYKVIGHGRLKFNGEWYDSINYIALTNSSSAIYTRTLENFKDEFILELRA